MRTLRLTPALLLVLAAIAPLPARGQDSFEAAHDHAHDLFLVQEVDHFQDGSSRVRSSRILTEVASGHSEPGFLRAARAAKTHISVRNTLHWDPDSKIKFKITRFFKDEGFLKLLRKAVKTLNQQRGGPGVPKLVATGKTVGVKGIDEFEDSIDFYFQHFGNGMNEVIMTDDDQMFRFPPPDDNIIIDPTRTATTRRMGGGSCQRQGNKFLCTFCNVEADILMRSDFFDVEQFRDTQQTAVLLLALGYNPTLWTNDVIGRTRPYVTEEAFDDKQSDVWKQIRERNIVFYPQGLKSSAATTALSAAQPVLLPRPDTVIDFAGVLQPDRDFTDLQTFRPALVVTNLVGPKSPSGPNATLQVTLFRLEKTLDDDGNVIDTKQIKIAKLKGQTEGFVVELGGTDETGTDTPFLSDVGFAGTAPADKAIDDLHEAIEEFGRPMVIDGISWSKVLEGRIEVKGRLTDQPGLAASARRGPLAKIKKNYYFVNSDEESPPI